MGRGWGWGKPSPGQCPSILGENQSLVTLPLSLLSASRVLVPSDLELTTCLSPTVLHSSLLTSPQTACDGRVLWVTIPPISGLLGDRWKEPDLSYLPLHILCQWAWRMLGHVGLRSGTGCELGGCCVRLLTFVVLCIRSHVRPWESREVKFSCLSF